MSRSSDGIAIRLNKRAADMLVDFVNADADAAGLERFSKRWRRGGLEWLGGVGHFQWEQQLVRDVWEGKKRGIEGFQVKVALFPDDVIRAPIDVDWEHGVFHIRARDLNQLIWLTLLQHSRSLGICENPDCRTRYFLKYRPQQRFCSDRCALPAQKAAKRRWWSANRGAGLAHEGHKSELSK